MAYFVLNTISKPSKEGSLELLSHSLSACPQMQPEALEQEFQCVAKFLNVWHTEMNQSNFLLKFLFPLHFLIFDILSRHRST